MNFSERTRAVFGPGTPEHTPADRLDALHHVANEARALLASWDREVYDSDGPELSKLRCALGDLDKIERYLGVRAVESAA